MERNRPGGVGIADLQPFLRPSLEAREEVQEWKGVTERMVDEVDESNRKNKVYDLRLEPSGMCLFERQVHEFHEKTHNPCTDPHGTVFHNPLSPDKYFLLTKAFVEWGGFAPSPSQATTGPSATPTFDRLIKRGSKVVKTNRPATTTTTAAAEDEPHPPPVEAPYKPFNYEFDEPVHSTKTQTSVSSQAEKASSAQPKSLLTMQREGKRLSKKQKALLQAAAISRTPLPNPEEKALAEAKEKQEREAKGIEADSEPKMETDEEKKQFQDKVWSLVKGKWF